MGCHINYTARNIVFIRCLISTPRPVIMFVFVLMIGILTKHIYFQHMNQFRDLEHRGHTLYGQDRMII